MQQFALIDNMSRSYRLPPNFGDGLLHCIRLTQRRCSRSVPVDACSLVLLVLRAALAWRSVPNCAERPSTDLLHASASLATHTLNRQVSGRGGHALAALNVGLLLLLLQVCFLGTIGTAGSKATRLAFEKV